MTLVLGLATSALSLQQMLPAAAADCLQTRHFQLVQVRGAHAHLRLSNSSITLIPE